MLRAGQLTNMSASFVTGVTYDVQCYLFLVFQSSVASLPVLCRSRACHLTPSSHTCVRRTCW